MGNMVVELGLNALQNGRVFFRIAKRPIGYISKPNDPAPKEQIVTLNPEEAKFICRQIALWLRVLEQMDKEEEVSGITDQGAHAAGV